MTQSLKTLHDKVEAGTAIPPDFYQVWSNYVGDCGEWAHCAFMGSLDAAKALHDAVLPGWTLNGLWEKRHPDKGQHPTGEWVCLLFGIVGGKYYGPEVTSNDPARAWLLAILRALINEDQQP